MYLPTTTFLFRVVYCPNGLIKTIRVENYRKYCSFSSESITFRMTTALNQYPYPLINQPTGPPYVDNTGNIAANTLQPPRKVPVAGYNGFAGCSTGWIQLCCGVATILLASAQIILQTTLNIIGHGIWGGVVVSDYDYV